MREEFKSDRAATPPRFQIVDLLAIVAAFALGLGLVRTLFESGQIRVGTTNRIAMQQITPRVLTFADAVVPATFLAVAVGITFAHPALIAAQFFTRRRRRLIDWRTCVGSFPTVTIAVVTLSVLLARQRSQSAGLLGVIPYLLVGNAILSLLLLIVDNPKSNWLRTDWYGCAVAILYGIAVLLAMAGV